jgi:hypothetical protein
MDWLHLLYLLASGGGIVSHVPAHHGTVGVARQKAGAGRRRGQGHAIRIRPVERAGLVSAQSRQAHFTVGQTHHRPGCQRRPTQTRNGGGLNELVADVLVIKMVFFMQIWAHNK